MMTPEVLQAFAKEAAVSGWAGKQIAKGGRFAKDWAVGSAKETGQIAKDFATSPVKTLREGVVGLTNTDPGAVKRQADSVRSANAKIRAKKVQSIREGKGSGTDQGRYVHETPEQMSKARRLGFLSNTSKYEGPNKLRKTVNTVRRALPGQAVLQGAGLTADTGSELIRKEDPSGRRIGVGERLTAAGGTLAGGLSTSRHGLVAGYMGSEVGRRAGRLAGRTADKAVPKRTGGAK